MYWRGFEVGQVNANLCHVLLFQVPTDGLAVGKPAWLIGTPALRSYIQGYSVRNTKIHRNIKSMPILSKFLKLLVKVSENIK